MYSQKECLNIFLFHLAGDQRKNSCKGKRLVITDSTQFSGSHEWRTSSLVQWPSNLYEVLVRPVCRCPNSGTLRTCSSSMGSTGMGAIHQQVQLFIALLKSIHCIQILISWHLSLQVSNLETSDSNLLLQAQFPLANQPVLSVLLLHAFGDGVLCRKAG